jgi:hypothetical protein
MFRRKWLLGLPVAAAVVAVGADRWLAQVGAEAKQDLKPAVTLPVTRVVLFSSGVGYFSRSGEVDGDARVDLTFPETDINDLLKSMVLEDLGGGRVAAVSYDSREPAARTLASFAINLSDNPSLADILTQARGERVEVTAQPTAQNQPGKLVGSIVGVETRPEPGPKDGPPVPAAVLNLWCAEGLRSIKLADIQQLKFTNPAIESEVRRALEVLATNHDTEKKAVSLHFAGDGKRQVRVGYVVEAPIWKTSYRLVLDGENGGKPFLQGWAAVENPSDEDWSNVKMALVSGRPISFKMDLYNPLYVPRPTVEPELFASLRPPTYDPGFDKNKDALAAGQPADPNGRASQLAERLSSRGRPGAAGGLGGAPAGGGTFGSAEFGVVVAPEAAAAGDAATLGRRGMMAPKSAAEAAERRKFAAAVGKELAGRMDLAAVGSAASGGQLGDFFQYAVDHPVSLARQKSALLPIVTKEVEAARVSIYNPAVQPKHPLLGLRFKNTTGNTLAQGPVTVFEGSTYAGDTRVLDVPPGEERLVSYAIDLATEVDPQVGDGTSRITSVKATKGIVATTTKVREVRKYRIANRGTQDRTLLVEHPNRTNQGFKLVDTDKPAEDTKDVYRFQFPVKAKEEKTFVVAEERDVRTDVALSNNPDGQIRYFLSLNEASEALKAKLNEALKAKAAWDAQTRELQQVVADLQRLTQDQARIRQNLAQTPAEAEVYKTYLKKLSDQEKEIDGLTDRQKKLMAAEFEAKKAFEDFLANLSD